MPSAKTVDEMILHLPRNEQVIVNYLRELVRECLPAATEKGYYGEGVPFYTRHRMICFIWPSSVSWGPQKEKQTISSVSLGFCQGNLMANEDGILKAEGRKQVYVMSFKSMNDIREKQVRALLFEASMIDDTFGEKKKRKSSENS